MASHALSRKAMLAAVSGLIWAAGALAVVPALAQSAPPPLFAVHGVVAAALPQAAVVPLPNAAVTLVDAQSSAPHGETMTTSAGSFATPPVAAGTYRACAKASGFAEACSEPVTVAKGGVALKQLLLLKPQGAVLYGRVTLKDGSPAARVATAAAASQGAAQVSLADGGGHVVAGPVSVNADATYVLPAGAGTGLTLSARYEDASVSEATSLEPNDAAKRVDLVLPSAAPTLEAVTMTRAGKPITTAARGDTIVITLGVKNAGSGALHYRWRTNSSGLIAKDAPAVTWTLPNTAAANVLFFEVTNGQGGVLRSSITIPVQAAQGGQQPAQKPTRSLGSSLLQQALGNLHRCLFCGPITSIPAHQGLFIDPTLLMGGACNDEASCEAEATTYYNSIAAPASFKAWKAQFKFGASPATPAPNEMRATYYNNGDLQFGRDMHCQFNAGIKTMACYVSNYGAGATTFGSDPQTAIGNAAANTGRIASVAMKFVRGELIPPGKTQPVPDSFVQFYVYGVDAHDEDDGPLLKAAVLDSQGPKAVPGICLTCHGGQYDPTGHMAELSSFLPFDVPSFILSTTQPALEEPAQRDTFRSMNLLAEDAAIGHDPVGGLVGGWYAWCGGVLTAGCGIDDVNHPFYPSGSCPSGFGPADVSCKWPAKWGGVPAQPFYQGVPRRYCRTCHVAQSSFLNIENFDDWTGQCTTIKGFVLASEQSPPGQNFMPFAEVPYDAFWQDSAAQVAMGYFLAATPNCP